MPLIDMSAALTNPYTLDSFRVDRRTEILNDFGEVTVDTVPTNNVAGVVYPMGKQELDRFPNMQMNAKGIEIITKFALRSSSETVDGVNYQPDVIFWNGNSFVVASLEDYSRYGTGFVKASCIMMDLNPQPEQTT